MTPVPDALPAAEFAASPLRAIVHDPARTRAFAVLDGTSTEEMQERFLFRARPDQAAFSREHAALAVALRGAGVDVVRLGDLVPEPLSQRLDENPNHVYTRDSAIVLPWLPGRFLRGRMRKAIRRDEPEVAAAALRALGLEELPLSGTGRLEGGDVIPFSYEGRRTLLVGFGPRTTREALDDLRETLMPAALDAIVGVELVPERMNLDGVLVPVADDTVLVDPSSIVRGLLLDETGERAVDVLGWFRELGTMPVEVTRAEATTMQACNAACLGERRVVLYDLCERVVAALRGRDIEVFTIPGRELIKGTGGPRCMTRPLYS